MTNTPQTMEIRVAIARDLTDAEAEELDDILYLAHTNLAVEVANLFGDGWRVEYVDQHGNVTTNEVEA